MFLSSLILVVASLDLPNTRPTTLPMYLFEPGKSYYHRGACGFIRDVMNSEEAMQEQIQRGELKPCPVCCSDEIVRPEQPVARIGEPLDDQKEVVPLKASQQVRSQSNRSPKSLVHRSKRPADRSIAVRNPQTPPRRGPHLMQRLHSTRTAIASGTTAVNIRNRLSEVKSRTTHNRQDPVARVTRRSRTI